MFALLAFTIAGAAMQDPPPDPACPQGDLSFPRQPGSTCIGALDAAYAYSSIWPAEAASIPGLDRMLRRQATQNQRWIAGAARTYRADMARAGGEPIQLSYESGWTMDALTPALAAVSSAHSYYTGGAHGGMRYEVILFDRRAGRPIALPDLFADRRAGLAAVQEIFCSALTAEVSERRDGNVDGFVCPEAAGVPVTLTGGERGITGMRALIAPYVVGSWAEGPYEVDFPVTNGMRWALKPDYRTVFPDNEIE